MEDCYYFLYATCNRDPCKFRHSIQAKENPTLCEEWQLKNSCKIECPYRHSTYHLNKKRSEEYCYWETVSGCTKDRCEYKHVDTAKDQWKLDLSTVQKDEKEKISECKAEGEVLYTEGIPMTKIYKGKKCIINDIDFRWFKETCQKEKEQPKYDEDENGIVFVEGIPMFKIYKKKKCIINDVEFRWDTVNKYQFNYTVKKEKKMMMQTEIVVEDGLPKYFIKNGVEYEIYKYINDFMGKRSSTVGDLNLCDILNGETVFLYGQAMYTAHKGKKCVINDVKRWNKRQIKECSQNSMAKIFIKKENLHKNDTSIEIKTQNERVVKEDGNRGYEQKQRTENKYHENRNVRYPLVDQYSNDYSKEQEFKNDYRNAGQSEIKKSVYEQKKYENYKDAVDSDNNSFYQEKRNSKKINEVSKKNNDEFRKKRDKTDIDSKDYITLNDNDINRNNFIEKKKDYFSDNTSNKIVKESNLNQHNISDNHKEDTVNEVFNKKRNLEHVKVIKGKNRSLTNKKLSKENNVEKSIEINSDGNIICEQTYDKNLIKETESQLNGNDKISADYEKNTEVNEKDMILSKPKNNDFDKETNDVKYNTDIHSKLSKKINIDEKNVIVKKISDDLESMIKDEGNDKDYNHSIPSNESTSANKNNIVGFENLIEKNSDDIKVDLNQIKEYSNVIEHDSLSQNKEEIDIKVFLEQTENNPDDIKIDVIRENFSDYETNINNKSIDNIDTNLDPDLIGIDVITPDLIIENDKFVITPDLIIENDTYEIETDINHTKYEYKNDLLLNNDIVPNLNKNVIEDKNLEMNQIIADPNDNISNLKPISPDKDTSFTDECILDQSIVYSEPIYSDENKSESRFMNTTNTFLKNIRTGKRKITYEDVKKKRVSLSKQVKFLQEYSRLKSQKVEVKLPMDKILEKYEEDRNSNK